MLFTLLTALPSLLSGLFGTVNGITNAIANTKIAQINATTQEAQIQAQETINTLQARRDVMIAESAHSNINGIMRFIVAIGPATYLCKIFLYDKVLGPWTHGSTDALDPNLWQVVMVVLGFYFLYDASTAITRIFASRK